MTDQGFRRQIFWGRSRAILDVVTSVALLAASGAVLWASAQFRMAPSPPKNSATAVSVPSDPVTLAGRPVLGSQDAPLTLIEIADFECPYCGRFAREVFPVLRREYVDRGALRISFSHLPLTQIHPLALRAAQFSECAHGRGQFWAFYDQVFLAQQETKLDASLLENAAAGVGLTVGMFESCRAAADGVIAADKAFAAKLAITSTPAFVLGRTQRDGSVSPQAIILGAKPADEFRTELNKALGAVGK